MELPDYILGYKDTAIRRELDVHLELRPEGTRVTAVLIGDADAPDAVEHMANFLRYVADGVESGKI